MTYPLSDPCPSVTFYGAAQAVTGSMHLLQANGQRYLLDCGLILGQSTDVRERNRRFPFEPGSLRAVLISHAHIDHCGNVPNLVRQGFAGPIYCTPATRDLLAIMLTDSARIQADEAAGGGIDESSTGTLYTGREVEQTLRLCAPVPYDAPVELGAGITARFVDAGHLLGSAMIVVTCTGPYGTRTVTYTGDLGRSGLNFLCPPAPLPESDLVISESTYGGRMHQSFVELSATFQDVVRRTAGRKGKVLVPAFNLGRSQLVAHYLRRWQLAGQIPDMPIYVDSPLAADVAAIHRRHPGGLSADARAALAVEDDGIHYLRSRAESRALSERSGPYAVIASGGMCDAGRIIPHLERGIDDPRNTVVLVSYQAPGSLGRRLLERGPTVRYRQRVWNKWADVIDLNGFSGHADRADFLAQFRPLLSRQPRIRLVHGEYEQAHQLAEALRDEGFAEVDIPRREEYVCLA